MKKLISILLCLVLAAGSMILPVYAETLTDEQLAEKNYPVPDGYGLDTVLATYDESVPWATSTSLYSVSQCTDEGYSYSGGSLKYTAAQGSREVRTYNNSVTINGDGYCFWYKSEKSVAFRVREADTNYILYYGSLDASPEGRWVTVYNYGKFVNMSVNSSSKHRNITDVVAEGKRINFYLMSNSSDFCCYVDEFFTFSAKQTPADSYTDTNDFFKFSLANLQTESRLVAAYSDDGSVTMQSTYGSTAVQDVFSATYAVNAQAAAAALEQANKIGGSGYLRFTLDNISVLSADGTANAYICLSLSLDGLDCGIKLYSIDVGKQREYLINVSGISDLSLLTGVSISAKAVSSTNKVRDVKLRLSGLSVYRLPEGSVLLQAEALDPVCRKSRTDAPYEAIESVSSDSDNCYITQNSSDNAGAFIKFSLSSLAVGEYTVFASTLDRSNRSVYAMSVNNKTPISGFDFAAVDYASYSTDRLQKLGVITIDRENSIMKMLVTKKNSSMAMFDFFIFQKTDTAVTAVSPSFLTIKPYPEMERYELCTLLDDFNEYICGTDSRWTLNQVYGDVESGTAFNLNSRGTVGKGWFDNNTLCHFTSLTGEGLRFWYKAKSNAELQFKTSDGRIKYIKKLDPLPDGGWLTIFFNEFVANSDLTDIISISLKTSSGNEYYVDELHTIQQKIGTLKYTLREGKAYVSGYDLRLVDPIIPDEYNGCPVVGIDEGALAGLITLKSITMPESVTEIGKNAFAGCLNLQSISMPGVKQIADSAFADCARLGEVTMPSTLETVAQNAFSGCTDLTLTVSGCAVAKQLAQELSLRYRDSAQGLYYLHENGEITLTSAARMTVADLPEYIDSYPVTAVADGFMQGDNVLRSLSAPSTLKAIGKNAFSGCLSLESVMLDGIESIDECAFSDCTLLSSVTLGNTIKTLGSRCFSDCTALDAITLPVSLESAQPDSFNGCTSLVVDITKGSYAYEYANTNSLKYIPKTDSEYKYYVINYNATVMSYTGNSVDIIIPESIDGYAVTAIGENAFRGNTAIQTLRCNNAIVINSGAFFGCTSLKEIDFGEVLKINSYAFYGCTALTKLSLRDLVEVSATAFSGCDNLNLNIQQTQFQRTALKYVEGMTAGWNLGNTFDAYSETNIYGSITPEQSERLWGAPTTTKEMIDLVAASGFNTIRIPVTWQSFLDENDKIDPAYLARIKEVIGYAYANDMYVILNVHHDTWLDLSLDDFDGMRERFIHVWAQLADEFKYYDEKLILESLNEVISGNDWYCHDTTKFPLFNQLNQAFYETVRESGGLNDRRYLLLESYGAQYGDRHLNSMWLPENDDHIIASVHMYINTMTAGHYTPNIERVYKRFVAKGIPCIIGEVGIPIWYDEQYCANWARFYLKMCNDSGLKCVFWDDHGNYTMMLRTSLSWKYPAFIDAIRDMTNNAETLYGDVTHDNAVNAKDKLRLLQYLAGYAVSIDADAADVNIDGAINAKDVLLLQKFLSGHDIILGLK